MGEGYILKERGGKGVKEAVVKFVFPYYSFLFTSTYIDILIVDFFLGGDK